MQRLRHGSAWLILGSLLLVVTLVMTPMADAAGKKRDKPGAQNAASGWQLVFKDDFDERALDARKWATAFPWGRDRSSVGELQYYAPDAFRLKNGHLSIVARPSQGGSHAYDSGLISSHDSFAPEYGRFEIRCKIPQGKGLWPAFWLLPLDTSWPPEIDVFEALGDDPETVHLTAHWSDGGVHRQKGSEFTGPDFSEDFHTFAVEWTPETLTWFVDGVKRHEVSGRSPSGPMYLLANLAVGGDWPGAPDASTRFPASFDIDYIRAYAPSPAPEAGAKAKNDKKKKANRKNRKQKRRRAGLVKAGGLG
ncbi:MAG: glycoside hydrolase family 16 protein [Thermomicrobiales bacterium]|nr:glycoside hydrolase family 16 protein [Thermomicrobiales bacterium]